MPKPIFQISVFLCTLLAIAHSASLTNSQILPNVTYSIRSRQCGNRALSIDNSGNIVVQDYAGSPRQHWYFSPACGAYYIASGKSPKVLDAYQPYPNFQCRAEDYLAERSQRWKLAVAQHQGYNLFDWEGKALTMRHNCNNGPVETVKLHDWNSQAWILQVVDK